MSSQISISILLFLSEKSMEVDNPEGDGVLPTKNNNNLVLHPVSPNDSGEGLPYAPIDWPNPGDNWSWKTGCRVAISGHYLDRYLYSPISIEGKRRAFASKLSVQQYICKKFPTADIDSFFASFIWRIPARNHINSGRGGARRLLSSAPLEELEEPLSDAEPDGVRCKAGNKNCTSLTGATDTVMPCDICCSEPGFCRNCCCILCCKFVSSSYGGYSYIKCEATVNKGFTCGHIAHLDCALRSFMAGTVKGSIGLDAEYHCRHCDTRTDLVLHASRLFETCQTINSHDDIQKVLRLGICLLRDSEKENAKKLFTQLQKALGKLKCVSQPEDIWKFEDNVLDVPKDPQKQENEVMDVFDHRRSSLQIEFTSQRDQIDALKLEDEIHQVLEELRKSQEYEYKVAEELLNAQKSFILNLYQQLDKERSELANGTASAVPDILLDTIMKRMDQIKKEVQKLRDMEEVAHGFGRTPKSTLREHFGFEGDS